VERVAGIEKPLIEDRRLFHFRGLNRSGNGEWQTVTIVADYWQSEQGS
jgi:hypothetical protein